MGRLVITRKPSQSFDIADGLITVTVMEINRNQAKISINAPNEVKILRSELIGRKRDVEDRAAYTGANGTGQLHSR